MTARPAYKTTEMGQIPQDWEVVRLDEVAADFISGGTPSTSNPDFWSGKIPWMRSASIRSRFVDSGEKFISEKGLENSATNVVPKGSLLVASRVSIGNVAVNRIDVAISQDLTGIVVKKERANEEYLYWILKHRAGKLRSFNQGSTIKGVLREDLRSLRIPLPTIREQEGIAAILSSVDDAIQKTNEIIAQTQRFKKGLMQQLITKGIGHTKFKHTEIGEIPDGWEVVRLESLISSYRNGIYKRPEFYGRGSPSVRMYNIVDGKINTIGAPLLEVTDEELEQYGLIPGDIVVNRVNTIDLVGKAGIVPEGLGPATFESKNIRARVLRDRCNPKFIAYFMNTDVWYREIRSGVKPAVAQATVNQEDLNKLLVPLPSLDEQQKIAVFLSSLDEKIEHEKSNNGHFKQLKKGLMQILLTGKIRVKVN